MFYYYVEIRTFCVCTGNINCLTSKPTIFLISLLGLKRLKDPPAPSLYLPPPLYFSASTDIHHLWVTCVPTTLTINICVAINISVTIKYRCCYKYLCAWRLQFSLAIKFPGYNCRLVMIKQNVPTIRMKGYVKWSRFSRASLTGTFWFHISSTPSNLLR